MTPLSPQPQTSGIPLFQGVLPTQATFPESLVVAPFSAHSMALLPRFNASYAVVFVRDGAQKRRDLAYARARDLQRELGVSPGLQCVPSLP
ncbi:MAG: hypothetical protein QE263_04075 [Vampirovibrionales bacterium]|nr:hypothetical protein [Vampirovibrionales bacterium]